MDQKWIAFFGQSKQAYIEWRRTGYPKLDPGDGKGNTNGTIPRRGVYGEDAASLNGKNLQMVLKTQGPDLLSTRTWLDPKR
jgi:hypothetical protein